MRKLSLLLFLSLSYQLFSQDLHRHILWETNDSILYFKNASYDISTGNLPQYSLILPWNSSNKIPNVKIQTISSSKPDSTFSSTFGDLSFNDSPDIEYQLVYDRKEALLQIKLNPFFLNKTTKQIEKLDSFNIHITEVEALAKLKTVKKNTYANSSVLASKTWYKVGIQQSGMHKLSYEQLEEIGLSNPAAVKVFGAGAVKLQENFSDGKYDDLLEVPLYLEKGSDNLFGPGDYILFYAQGPVTWSYNIGTSFFSHDLHNYDTEGFYFLTDGLGQPASPANATLSNETANEIVTSYDILDYFEEETYNLIESGREWYGEKFEMNPTGSHTFNLNNLITSSPVKIKATAAGRSNESSKMFVEANNSSIGSLSFSAVNLSSHTATYAIESSQIFEYISSSEIITALTEYQQPNTNSMAWLNHLSINGRASLMLNDNELAFRDANSASFGNTAEFKVTNCDNKTLIWEITDYKTPKNIPFTLSGTTATFKLSSDEIREFIAFKTNASFPSPRYTGDRTGRIENQNLHGSPPPDLLIVYAEEFAEQVERLAEHRRSHDELSVLTITEKEIFNEFSSGTRDVSALRNLLKMYYDNNDVEDMTKYLLLFGDGSYANNDTSSNNPNYLLTYQSVNSLSPTSSYVSDDFFGLLDNGESLYDGMLDIGIGRIPVSSAQSAEEVVDKIIAYDNVETMGDWRNYICFIGDDEDGNLHMKQANSLANYVEATYPDYNINKIFLDAYVQESTASGDRYPDVNQAINEQMKRGALIINYTGHGGESGLAHERIVELTDIKAWDNEGMWPLFMTATCEFSRYDAYNYDDRIRKVSPGEEVLLNSVGGAVALFTTTRLVYSGPNHVLNEKFYERVFEKDPTGNCYRLGDIIKYSKNQTGSGINKRNFTLLGDPTTSLSFPRHVIITDSINHQSLAVMEDTISALNFVSISGHIEDIEGNTLSGFNGQVVPVVYDKESNITTLGNDTQTTISFQSRNNILYKGNATVENGMFSFNFYVPLDIGYNIGKGKISYYASSESSDAHGSTKEITIGGLGDFSEMDTIGPEINIFINDSLFKNGGIVDKDPELVVYINDPYGINTTGNGIGHDITATLDDDRVNALILNEYYKSALNDYSSGVVRYPYKDLTLGKHSINVKIWDIFNNSANKTLDFLVVEDMNMLLENIYNYPNPFVDITYFNIEHNRPGQELDVIIKIYDLSGTLITVLDNTIYSEGYRIDPVEWNGTGYSGSTLGSGIYVYQLLVKTPDGEAAAGSGRIIMRK